MPRRVTMRPYGTIPQYRFREPDGTARTYPQLSTLDIPSPARRRARRAIGLLRYVVSAALGAGVAELVRALT